MKSANQLLKNLDKYAPQNDEIMDFSAMQKNFSNILKCKRILQYMYIILEKFTDDNEDTKSKQKYQVPKTTYNYIQIIQFPLLDGQSMMTLQDLETEMEKSRKKNDRLSVISLIYTTLKKTTDKTKKLKLLREQLKYFEQLQLVKQQLQTIEEIKKIDPDDIQNSLKLTKIYLSKQNLFKSFHQFQLLDGLFHQLPYQETKQNDKLKHQINELRLTLQFKLNSIPPQNQYQECWFIGKENTYGCLGRIEQIHNFESAANKKINPIQSFVCKKVSSISCGDYHTVAVVAQSTEHNNLNTESVVVSFGYNYHGQANGVRCDEFIEENSQFSESAQQKFIDFNQSLYPMIIPIFEKRSVTHVAASLARSLCVTQNLEVYEWGSWCFDDYDYPDQILLERFRKIHILDKKVDDVRIGAEFNLFLLQDGQAYMSGNIDQPLSYENIFYSKELLKLQAIKDDKSDKSQKIKSISTGYFHAVLLDQDQNVWSLGSGAFGQLGLGLDVDRSGQPRLLLQDDFVVNITAGPHYGAAYTDYGLLYIWGLTIPNDLESIKWFPTIFRMPKGTDTQLVHIAGNSRELMAIDQRGRLFECDLSYQGQLAISEKNGEFEKYPIGSILCGKSMQILLKKVIDPKRCEIVAQPKKLITQIENKFSIKLVQKNGSKYFMSNLSEIPNLSVLIMSKQNYSEEVKIHTRQQFQKSLSYKNQVIQSQQQDKLNPDQQLRQKFIIKPHPMNEISYTLSQAINQQNRSILDIVLNPESKDEGLYIMSILLQNGENVMNSPLQIELMKNVSQKQTEQQLKKDQLLKKEKQKQKARKQRELKMKKQQDRLRKQLQKAQQEKKRKEATEKRAIAAVKKLQEQQAQKAMQEIEDRKTRREMRTGGGFNMSKKKVTPESLAMTK